MAIQFHCRTCQGWIEVDDEHAGAKAVCPFCQAINAVPIRSEPQTGATGGQGPSATTPAEPARRGVAEESVGGPPGRQASPAMPSQDFERDQDLFGTVRARMPATARAGSRLAMLGLIGLILAVLSIVMMAAVTAIAVANLPASLRQQLLHAQPASSEEARQLQKQVMEALMAFAEAHAWLGAVSWLSLLLWLVSLVANLAVVFSSGTHRRTHGWAGLVANTLVLFGCLCSSIMQRFMGS
jgi:hypothetical protein